MVVGAVAGVDVSVWVVVSEYVVWLRRTLAGAVAWLVWVSSWVGVVRFGLELRVVAAGWLS